MEVGLPFVTSQTADLYSTLGMLYHTHACPKNGVRKKMRCDELKSLFFPSMLHTVF